MGFVKQWFTERDNQTACIVRAMLTVGGVAMIYKFAASGGDFQSFGLGLAGIGAAIAAKNASEQ